MKLTTEDTEEYKKKAMLFGGFDFSVSSVVNIFRVLVKIFERQRDEIKNLTRPVGCSCIELRLFDR